MYISHALGTRTHSELEILNINVISGFVYGREIILESSWNNPCSLALPVNPGVGNNLTSDKTKGWYPWALILLWCLGAVLCDPIIYISQSRYYPTRFPDVSTLLITEYDPNCFGTYPNVPEAGREAGWGSEFVPLKKREVGGFILLYKIPRTACYFGTRTFLKQYNCYESATIWYTNH